MHLVITKSFVFQWVWTISLAHHSVTFVLSDECFFYTSLLGRRFLSTATALLKLHAVQWFWSELIGLSDPSNLKLKMVSDIHVHVLSWELYTLHFTHAGMFKMVVFDLCCCFQWAEGFSNLTACLWHIFGMVSDRHYSFREMYKSGPCWTKEKSPEKTWARDLKSEPILFWATPRL